MDLTSTVTKSPSLDSESNNVVSTQPPPFIPFQTGPSLERIPDDILLDVVSHFPTIAIDDSQRSCYEAYCHPRYLIPSTLLARTSTLRALSQTSRLLRSRCLALAWQRTAFWGPNIRRLDASMSYLLPLIRTVSIMLTTYQKAEIIPAFAACLATLPNLNTIQVIYTETRMQTAIKDAFRGKRFPSVRRISLPSSAHEIIKRCPNLEGKIIQSIVEGKCHQVRILKGISAPLTRLVGLVPNLTHASVVVNSDMSPLTSFLFLDTIEILVRWYDSVPVDLPLSEFLALDIKKAREILKGNKSQAPKTVVLTQSNNCWDYRVDETDLAYITRETVKV
ncbi:hypothetical protein EV363DRAFT_1434172 [Boletus edulis]|nr:hypothetical protein EV363DRAFT_1434172 [Boletus edulis]